MDSLNYIGSMKAPSPDGLNSHFYNFYWDAIKDYVCRMVINVFQHRLYSKGVESHKPSSNSKV